MTGTTTSYTPPASVAVVTTATVTATAGTLTASTTITINLPPSITVTGNVIAANGLPVQGATVVIGTQNTPTGTDGSFSISGVTLPYDVTAVSGKFGVVYQQLHLTTPVTIVFPNLTNPTLPNSGTVTGNISPTTNLGVGDYETAVAWGSPETSLFADYEFIDTNPYSISLNWMGASSTTGNLHVLQILLDGTTDLPTSYAGYQTSSGLVVANSGTTTMDMTMTSLTSATLSGTLALPASSTFSLNLISFAFADGAMIWGVAADESGASTFTYTVPPASTGATTTLLALVESGGDVFSAAFASGLQPNATGVSLVVPEGAAQASPADGGSGITAATNFVWTPFSGGVHLVAFFPDVSTNPTYYVFTAASSTTIPDLSVEGLGLPSGGATYSWAITGMAPFATLDAFATGNNYSSFASALSGIIAQKPPVGVPDFSYSITNTGRNFTTQ